jgi:hypothetical protein
MGERTSRVRLPFLDWTRGVAGAIMLQGHVYHAFSAPEERGNSAYMFSQFFGGLAPAIFLFLTGITFAMGMDRPERAVMSRKDRWMAALGRARYLFILAFLFRAQLWVFGLPGSSWQDLLKVDILNCMGFAMALLALLAIYDARTRVRAGIAWGMAIAAISPLISMPDWAFLPWFLTEYIVPSYTSFSLFPWGAFLAFGIAAGSVLALTTENQMHRVMLWTTLVGFGLLLGGQYFSSLPFSIYSRSEYWLNSPALVANKMGCVLLLVAVAFLWTYHHHDRWSWLRQIGTNSLLIYWVHIELVYGRWFNPWKERLTSAQCALAAVTLIVAMLLLTLVWVRLARLFRSRMAHVGAARAVGKDRIAVREGLR